MLPAPYTFPAVLEPLFRGALIRVPVHSPELFLTFDDGPTPGVTPWVLDVLDRYNARAVFFLVGQKAERHPRLVESILERGHRIGNHTFHHLNGWKTPLPKYLTDVEKAASVLSAYIQDQRPLFRPPYGRLGFGQFRALKQNYRIVLWKRLSLDYNPAVQPRKILRYLSKNIQPGDIIVFHDSTKSFPKLKQILPPLLENWHKEGYSFKNDF